MILIRRDVRAAVATVVFFAERVFMMQGLMTRPNTQGNFGEEHHSYPRRFFLPRILCRV
jgi:hypothetical protein